MEVMVRRYKSDGEYQREAARLAASGWHVANVVQDQRRSGCMRWLTIGLFALIWKPKPVFVVTYQRG